MVWKQGDYSAATQTCRRVQKWCERRWLFSRHADMQMCPENGVKKGDYLAILSSCIPCIPVYPRGIGCCGWDSRNENIFCATKLFYFFYSLTSIIQTFSEKVYKVYIVYIIVRNAEVYRLISRFSTSPPSDLCTRYASGMHETRRDVCVEFGKRW